MLMEASDREIEIPTLVAETLAHLSAEIAREEAAFMERRARLEGAIADPDRREFEISLAYDRMRASIAPIIAHREAVIANLAQINAGRPIYVRVPAGSVSL